MSTDWKWVGGKWWKFDFHSHTPASYDYGKGTDKNEVSPSPKEWLLSYMRAGIDCVAVTDHNTGDWIDILKNAYNELYSEDHPEFRVLYIFPGVEITVEGNCHLIVILPCDKQTSDIDTLLGEVKLRGDKGNSDAITEYSLIHVLNEIAKMDAIAIPAHVEGCRGLFDSFEGITLEQILDHEELFAMEIIDPSAKRPTLYTDKKINWAEVLGSDSHHLNGKTGQRYPGSHFTWVKMSEPSLEGLRLALYDGSFSLKRSDQFSGDPNNYCQLAIEEIVVEKAKYLGMKDTFRCRLNPWLNTIIGGRGSGKSTLLEFLRKTLKKEGEIPKSLRDEFTKYWKTSTSRQDEGLLRDETVITVIYRTYGKRFRIRWTNGENGYQFDEEDSKNQWVSAEGDINQRFPVSMYSQKQIFEMAKSPQALLEIIDASQEVNGSEWLRERDKMVSDYISIGMKERGIYTELKEEPNIKGQLSDIKRKLKILEKEEHADVLKDFRKKQNQNNAINIWEHSWEESLELFGV